MKYPFTDQDGFTYDRLKRTTTWGSETLDWTAEKDGIKGIGSSKNKAKLDWENKVIFARISRRRLYGWNKV